MHLAFHLRKPETLSRSPKVCGARETEVQEFVVPEGAKNQAFRAHFLHYGLTPPSLW